MDKTRTAGQTVVVIGAGVIGLSCALRLQSVLSQSPQGRDVEVLIVAREWPTSIPGAPITHSADYASMWAGAHVRPIPASTPQLKREAQWLKETVSEFGRQLAAEPWVGISRTLGVEHLEAPPPEYTQQTKQSFEAETGIQGYRALGSDEVPEGVQLGFEYPTFCVNSPIYCGNLLRKFIAQGGKTLGRDLRSEWEAFCLRPNVKFVVNASGIGFGDPKSFPTRGQIVITDFHNATRTVTKQNKDGTWSFIIPRGFNGGTIMGGTKDPGSWQTEANPATRQRLIRGGQGIAKYAVEDPSKANVDHVGVISDVVGRRPTRDGGMRIQVEERQLTGTDGELRTGHVLHAYGAGGRGYEISWGVANEVAAISESILPSLLKTQSKL
ncbi:hypothetical protein ACO1O0_006821 [Amphichorda felina]